MHKKTVTYTNFNGVQVTEDFYFHLTQQELVELEMSTAEGYSALIQRIVNAVDNQEIARQFKKLINLTYGVKSPDGRKFEKSDEILADFMATEAYSVIFIEMLTDQAKAEEFFKGVMPAGLVPGHMAPGPKPSGTLPPPPAGV